MKAVMDDGDPTKHLTKQHPVIISDPVENEIDKITEGEIPEFRDSFVRWGAVVVCAVSEEASEASRNWLRYTLPRLLPWEGAQLRMAAMGELKKKESWRIDACNTREGGETTRTCAVVDLPKSAARALKVRQHREEGCEGVVPMATSGIPFPQINLQHSKSSSAVLVRNRCTHVSAYYKNLGCGAGA